MYEDSVAVWVFYSVVCAVRSLCKRLKSAIDRRLKWVLRMRVRRIRRPMIGRAQYSLITRLTRNGLHPSGRKSWIRYLERTWAPPKEIKELVNTPYGWAESEQNTTITNVKRNEFSGE
jgi:hypothetical protein